jgi:hypothetical protein
MAKALLVVGRNNQAITLGNFATFGSAPTTASYDVESKAAKPARIAGTISDLKARVNANGTGRSIILRKNSANSVLHLQPPNAAGAFEFLGSVSFAATDTYNLQVTGTAPAFILYSARAIWEASTGHSTFIASASTAVTSGVSMFVAFGSGFIAGTELFAQSRLKGSGIISKVAALVPTASSTPFTIRLRKNGTNANANFSIPAGATGIWEDLTSVDTFADNDAFCWYVTGQTGATSIQMVALVEYSAPQNDLFNLPIGTFAASASPQFMAIGGSSAATLVESEIEIDHGFDCNIGKMRLNNNANTVTSSVVLTLRKNGADTALFVTVPPGTTGEYESAGAALVTFGPTDKAAIKFTGGTSGGLNFSSVAVTEYPLAPQTLTQTTPHINASVPITTGMEVLWLTWDSVNKSPNAFLSVQNRVMSSNGVTFMAIARAIVGKTTGKWYWEIVVHIGTATATTMGGAINAQASLAQGQYPGSSPSGASLWWNGNSQAGAYVNTWTKANAATFVLAPGDFVVNFALDMDAGKLWIGKAGAWLSGADPAAGTLPWITGISGTVFPSAGVGHSFDNVRLRVGTNEFSHTPPSGFFPYISGGAILDTNIEPDAPWVNSSGVEFTHAVVVGPAPQALTHTTPWVNSPTVNFTHVLDLGPGPLQSLTHNTTWVNSQTLNFVHTIVSPDQFLTHTPAWVNPNVVNYVHVLATFTDLVHTTTWPNASTVNFVHTIDSVVALVQAVTFDDSLTDAFYVQAITTGPVDLAPQLYPNQSNVDYAHALQAGENNLPAINYPNQSFADYVHAIDVGPANLGVDTFPNQSTVDFVHVVTSGNDLAGGLYPNESAADYVHAISVGPVDLAAGVFPNQSATDYEHAIGVAGEQFLIVANFPNESLVNYDNAIDAPALGVLIAAHFPNSSTLDYPHAILGEVDIAQDITFENPATVDYQHTLEQYFAIDPDTFPNESGYYTHTVSVGTANLFAQTFTNQSRFRLQTIGGAIRLPAPRGASARYGDPGTTARPSTTQTRRP